MSHRTRMAGAGALTQRPVVRARLAIKACGAVAVVGVWRGWRGRGNAAALRTLDVASVVGCENLSEAKRSHRGVQRVHASR